jgi:hypothetical protein
MIKEPYQADQLGGVVEYAVSCECGRSHRVSAGAAGTRLACACGRQVIVPSLHVLRRQAGEAVLGPELLIEDALRRGELPTSSSCARCGEVTAHCAWVWAECEQAQIKEPGWTISPLALLFGWLILRRSGETRVLGRDLSFRLPIRLCAGCCGGLGGRGLREVFAKEPLYQRLLDKYPQASLSFSWE